MEKAYRVYKKVKIFVTKLIIPGSDLKTLKDGEIKTVKPEFDTYYNWNGGALCHSIGEVKQDVDDYMKQCRMRGIDDDLAIETLNS